MKTESNAVHPLKPPITVCCQPPLSKPTAKLKACTVSLNLCPEGRGKWVGLSPMAPRTQPRQPHNRQGGAESERDPGQQAYSQQRLMTTP